MRHITLDYIVEGTKGTLYATDRNGRIDDVTGAAIDSRAAGEGSLFFCIIGARRDAHDFLPDVREQGCHNVVVSDRAWADKMKALGDMNVILVEDTTMALVNLGTKYMDDWEGLTRVAITGSVGKTSTKEFMYSVLSSRYKTGKNDGNFNSEFGIPLTCFKFAEDIEFAINEIGLGYGLDMKYLVNIVKPDAAIITNVGTSHLEVYGSREKLRDAKLRITTALKKGGTLVVNSDCDMLKPDQVRANACGEFNLITVGSNDEADYRISEICDNGIDGVQCKLEINGHKNSYKLVLPVIGAHNLYNAALTLAVSGVYGVETEDAIAALANTESNDNRLDVRRGSMYTVINDCYNASPESMKAGIDIVMHSNAKRRGVILGDMFELGDNSRELHASVGTYAAVNGIDYVVTIGENSLAIAEAALEARPEMLVVSYATRDEAVDNIESIMEPGDVVLVKASRAMALEVLSDAISH
ncbi:MAG: UDP-N-acetylmuramoyl-tripeptide--D-alanyl-D-alanine ligase [Clostridiales bacterium]|nr:UDP-N-acetylmuramoyl-tripeptide--D-alanyl-D-alanine ligase [Candidatus Crickella merdequi]